MPVAGLPDPDQHWHCTRCEQWFEADEGTLYERKRFSRAGRIADVIRGGGKLLFRCDPCTVAYKRNRAIFWVVMAVLAGGAVLVQRFLPR